MAQSPFWPLSGKGNIVRQIGLKHRLVDTKVCAVDAVWSGRRFVYRLKDRAWRYAGKRLRWGVSDGVSHRLVPLPESTVQQHMLLPNRDIIHSFTKDRMEAAFETWKAHLAQTGMLWIP